MSQSGVLAFNSSGGAVVETLTGNSGGPVGPDASHNINVTGNTTMGITVVGNPGTNTLNIVASQATTTQFGTIKVATNAQALAGTDTNNAITSDDLAVKLGVQTLHGLPIGGGSAAAITWTAAPNDGQLLIGKGGLDPVLANLTPGAGISITNAPGSITIAASGTTTLNYVSVNNAASPYSVLSTDEYIAADTSGGTVTIRLPNAPSTGRCFIIKDKSGTSRTNNVTVTTVGGIVTLDGATSYTIDSAYQAIEVIFNGTSYELF